MIKTVILTLIALTIALGGGTASVWFALNSLTGIGAVSISGWTAYPDEGTDRADPYTRARFSREGELALGQAEGLRFVSTRDSAGNALRRECTYVIEGSVPPARFWTLYVGDADTRILQPVGLIRPATHSREMLRNLDGSFLLRVDRNPRSGNWLPANGAGPMTFVLTLYDTPAASRSSISETEMPQIILAECNE